MRKDRKKAAPFRFRPMEAAINGARRQVARRSSALFYAQSRRRFSVGAPMKRRGAAHRSATEEQTSPKSVFSPVADPA